MTKKLIEIDDALLAEAREILGASSQRETIALALDEIVRRQRGQDFVALLKSGAFDDLANPEIMAGAWRT
jgi:Arc/MetJ family transcription regulator